MRILFEVENLKFATPASVSRCGTVWLSQDTVATADLLQHTLLCLRADPVVSDLDKAPLLALQNRVADVMVPYCDEHCLLEQSIAWSLARTHIMETTATQLVGAFAGLLRQLVLDVVDYNMEHMEAPMAGEHFLPSSPTGWWRRRCGASAARWWATTPAGVLGDAARGGGRDVARRASTRCWTAS